MIYYFSLTGPGEFRGPFKLPISGVDRDMWLEVAGELEAPPDHYQVAPNGVEIELRPPADRQAADLAKAARRRDAVADRIENQADTLRAVALALLDELNAHGQAINELRQAIADATSLADLQQRARDIPDRPARTPGALKRAIRAKLDS